MLKKLLIITTALFLCSCGEMVAVKDSPELLMREELTSTVVIQLDGSRLITIRRGYDVYCIVLLPPKKALNVESQENKELKDAIH